jgi:tRNA(adenine34) deaminase
MDLHPSSSQPGPEHYMRQALELAREAAQAGEVPVGAVVVQGGEITGRGANRTRRDGIVSAHAEIVALAAAERRAGDYRLEDAELYVTIEPCLMCLGAIHQARVCRLYFGAPEPKFGALGSRYDLSGHPALSRLEFTGGLLAEESSALLGTFFSSLRERK